VSISLYLNDTKNIMKLKPIKNKTQLKQALTRIDELWGATRNTEKGDELDVLMLLVEKYEEEHYPIPPSDPIEAIKFLMEQKELTQYKLDGRRPWPAA